MDLDRNEQVVILFLNITRLYFVFSFFVLLLRRVEEAGSGVYRGGTESLAVPVPMQEEGHGRFWAFV